MLQGFLLGPLLISFFINDQPDVLDVLRFSYPYIIADDLKLLIIKRGHDQLQADLDAIRNWVTENKMGLAMDNCTTIYFRGYKQLFYLEIEMLNSIDEVNVLGIHIHECLSSEKHHQHRVKKANGVLCLLKRNSYPKIATNVKLGLYKSVKIPVLVYYLQCVALTKTNLTLPEKFQTLRKTETWSAEELRNSIKTVKSFACSYVSATE